MIKPWGKYVFLLRKETVNSALMYSDHENKRILHIFWLSIFIIRKPNYDFDTTVFVIPLILISERV